MEHFLLILLKIFVDRDFFNKYFNKIIIIKDYLEMFFILDLGINNNI